MILESKEEFEVQTRAWPIDSGKWEGFREFDTEVEAIAYANSDMNVRVVKRTVVTIKGEWEVVE